MVSLNKNNFNISFLLLQNQMAMKIFNFSEKQYISCLVLMALQQRIYHTDTKLKTSQMVVISFDEK